MASVTASTPWLVRMIEEQFHRDDEDRLIREGRTPAALIRPGEIEYKPCPYPGSRHGSPMNVSALRQMSGHWDDVLDACAALRETYAAQRGPELAAPPALPELVDLWRIGQLGSALPWFYLLREGGAQRTPAYAAGLAKITLGVGLWAQQLLVELLAGTWAPVPLTPQAIYDSSEAIGSLLGATEVCSGSEKMMLRFFEALVAGSPVGTGPAVARLLAERDRWQLFGAHYTNVKLVLWIHFLARRFVYADLVAALGPRPELTALLDGACEPPDFFLIGPPDHAAVPPASRALWIGKLAALLVPLAPDRSDASLVGAVLSIGLALGTTEQDPAATAEIATRHGLAPAAAAGAARALATYAKLDALLGQAATTVEDGLRRADPTAGPAAPFDAALRDRLLVQPPRAVLAAIAPEAFAALCPR